MSVSRYKMTPRCILGRMVTRLAQGTVADVKEGMVVCCCFELSTHDQCVEIRSGRRSTPPAARPVCGGDAAGCCPSGGPATAGQQDRHLAIPTRDWHPGYFRSSAYSKYTCPAPACGPVHGACGRRRVAAVWAFDIVGNIVISRTSQVLAIRSPVSFAMGVGSPHRRRLRALCASRARAP